MTLSFTYTSTTTKKRTIHFCVVPSIDSSILIQNYFNNHLLLDTLYKHLSSYNLNNTSSTSPIVDTSAVPSLEPNVCSRSSIQVDPSIVPRFIINQNTRDVQGQCKQSRKSCLLSTLPLTFHIALKHKLFYSLQADPLSNPLIISAYFLKIPMLYDIDSGNSIDNALSIYFYLHFYYLDLTPLEYSSLSIVHYSFIHPTYYIFISIYTMWGCVVI